MLHVPATCDAPASGRLNNAGSRVCLLLVARPDRAQVGPRPDTFGGTRRLVGHREEPLLFEAELVRVRPLPSATQAVQPVAVQQQADGGPGGATSTSMVQPLYEMPKPPAYGGQQTRQQQ